MPIVIESSGSFNNTDNFLRKMLKLDVVSTLERYGKAGVAALASATPAETGLTAESWTYEVTKTGGLYTITWLNTHMHNGVNIAILLQYGHGTGTGGYVQGEDYINPAIRPIFDKISTDMWKAVTSA